MKPLETTIEQVLRDAIRSEIASREYYRELAGHASDAKAKAKLLDLSERQILHRVQLEKRYRALVGQEPPEIDTPEIELPEDTERVDLKRALRIALEHERESESNFRFLAERTTDPALLKLFNELAEIEWKHKVEIQNEYDSVGGDPEALLFD